MNVRTVRRAPGALLVTLLVIAILATVSGTARTHAQVDDGEIVIFEECSVVSLAVQASDALFTNVFWRFGPDSDLGVNSKQVGDSINIGEVPAGTELILGIIVNETGNTFKTGPGSRNPDGEVHAIVSGNTVGFEDKAAGEPFADFDYDDAMLAISTEPCAVVQQVTLTVEINPASTGSGGVTGDGSYDPGVTANPSATPAAGSSFGGWSEDCGGFALTTSVLMNANKTCRALFLADSTPIPTPVATLPPPIAGPPPEIAIGNSRTSPSPATIGDEVIFRIDVTLTDVPLTNEAEVMITFDDSHLAYVGALSSDCSLASVGIVCDFGLASADFSFDLDFTALEVTTSTSTNATLGADFDGAGPGAAEVAGPAPADVAIVDVEGIQLPPLGDGSAGVGATGSRPLGVIALAVLALGAVLGTGAGISRRSVTER